MRYEDSLPTVALAVAKWLAEGRNNAQISLLQGFFGLLSTNLEVIKRSRELCILLEREREGDTGDDDLLEDLLLGGDSEAFGESGEGVLDDEAGFDEDGLADELGLE